MIKIYNHKDQNKSEIFFFLENHTFVLIMEHRFGLSQSCFQVIQ